MPIKALVFDMDETLTFGYDPERGEEIDLHYLSWQAVLAVQELELNYRQYATHLRGATNQVCELWLAEEFGLSTEMQLGEVKEQHYRDRFVTKYLDFRPGVANSLESLRSLGLDLGLLTNAPRGNVLAAEQKLKLWDQIDRRLALDVDDLKELNLNPKPAPDGLVEIQQRLDLRADQLIYIGDSVGDMRAAKSADIKAVGFIAGNDAQTLLSNGAAATISDFSELLPCVRELDAMG